MIPDTEVINAVLRGSKHRYMYMCANPDNPGYHAFAETDAQHNANKKRYVKWLNRNKIYRDGLLLRISQTTTGGGTVVTVRQIE